MSIYFISDGKHVKIGCSINPKERLSALQSGNPNKLTLLKTLSEKGYSESKLHSKFEQYKTYGEWFELSKEILDFIDNVEKDSPVQSLQENYLGFIQDVDRVFRRLKKVVIDYDKLVEKYNIAHEVYSISNIQKIAIQSFHEMRGYKYEDLAQAALGKVPDVDTLTHDEAISVIQHGNDLYKKLKK